LEWKLTARASSDFVSRTIKSGPADCIVSGSRRIPCLISLLIPSCGACRHPGAAWIGVSGIIILSTLQSPAGSVGCSAIGSPTWSSGFNTRNGSRMIGPLSRFNHPRTPAAAEMAFVKASCCRAIFIGGFFRTVRGLGCRLAAGNLRCVLALFHSHFVRPFFLSGRALFLFSRRYCAQIARNGFGASF